MSKKSLPSLRIGELEINPPIIQGGMGVRVSRSSLASAVANEGCAGIIAAVGLGEFENLPGREFVRVNRDALRREIQKARKMTDGIIGVNIMNVLSNYQDLVETSVKEEVDLIISGAGLPFNLPKFLNGKNIKLIPIVSSAKALKIICKKWKKSFNRAPDGVIVEGEKAGGHLGYKYEDVINNTVPMLDKTVLEVIDVAKSTDPQIPVIAAGGIFDGKDIAHFLKLGAAGVQMGTRFVCTVECDVHENFKQAYLKAGKGDTTIIKSPVGIPGRVLKNSFVEKIKSGKTIPYRCNYHCLKTCNPKIAPYCIALVLANAAEGNVDESFVFAGSNVFKCDEIVTVHALIDKLVEETKYYLYR